MLSDKRKKDLIKTAGIGYGIWSLLVLLTFLLSESVMAASVIAVAGLIAPLRFIIRDYLRFRRESEDK